MLLTHSHPEPFFELASDVLAVVAPDGTIESVNASCRRVLGYERSELVGRRWQELVHPSDRAGSVAFVQQAAAQAVETPAYVNRYLRPDGGVAWVEWRLSFAGERFYASGRDVTEEHASAERAARTEALWRVAFEQAGIGMCVLDRDLSFLEVNDALCEFLGRSAAELIGNPHTVVTAPEHVPSARSRMRALLAGETDRYTVEREYLRGDGERVWGHLTVTRVDEPGDDVRVIGQVHDISEHKATEARLADDLGQLAALRRVRAALDDHRVVLHTQPIVDLQTRAIVREEALVRIEEDAEILTPDRFLPAAERFRLVPELDLRVLRLVLAQARRGRALNVNLSPLSLGGATLELVTDAVREGLDPSLLTFEITETALTGDMAAVERFVDRASRLGCGVAIDDFGVGYGSLRYLRELPGVSGLKIDRSFVARMGDHVEDRRIVEALLSLARDLGKDVVAEGVEDEATAQRLRDAGVRYAQGYLFGRPGPA
jgi:PAS domain S-box-containing protein